MLDLTVVVPMSNHIQHFSQCMDQIRLAIGRIKSTEVLILDDWSVDMTDFFLSLETLPVRVIPNRSFSWGEPLRDVQASKLVVLVNPQLIYDPGALLALAEPVLRGLRPVVSPFVRDYAGNPYRTSSFGIPWGAMSPHNRHWDGKVRYIPAIADDGLVVMGYQHAIDGAYRRVDVDMTISALWRPYEPFQFWFDLYPAQEMSFTRHDEAVDRGASCENGPDEEPA